MDLDSIPPIVAPSLPIYSAAPAPNTNTYWIPNLALDDDATPTPTPTPSRPATTAALELEAKPLRPMTAAGAGAGATPRPPAATPASTASCASTPATATPAASAPAASAPRTASRNVSTTSTGSRKRAADDDGGNTSAKRVMTSAGLDIIKLARAERHSPRFEPTPEETQYLEELYIANDHPSMEVRRRAADYLGIELKKVTTWFSNRNSKRREVCGITGYAPPDLDALAAVVPLMGGLLAESGATIIPAYIFRLGCWTRALAHDGPGVDFAVALRASPPTLLLATVHAGVAYRVSIPLRALVDVSEYASPSRARVPGSLALRAEVQPTACRFARLGPAGWQATGDFTGGANNNTTPLEIMGWDEDIRAAITSIHALLAQRPAAITVPVPAVHASISEINASVGAPPVDAHAHAQAFPLAPAVNAAYSHALPTPLTAAFGDDVPFPFAFAAPGTTASADIGCLSRNPTPLVTPGTAPAATATTGLGIDLGAAVDAFPYFNFTPVYAPAPTPTPLAQNMLFTTAAPAASMRPATAAAAVRPVTAAPSSPWGVRAADVTGDKDAVGGGAHAVA